MSQGMDRLRVWEAVKTGYGSIWLHRQRLAWWAVVPLGLAAIVDLAIRPYTAGFEQMASGGPEVEWMSGVVAAAQLRSALSIAVWTGLELPCYRLFLLGTGMGLPGPRWRSIYFSLLIFNLALFAVLNLPAVAVDYARIVGGVAGTGALDLALTALYGFLAVRLAFVFPAICLDWPWDLRQRWIETRGNFWRLLGAFMLAFVPGFGLSIAFAVAGIGVPLQDPSAGPPAVLEAVAVALASLALLLPGVAVTVAAVAQLTGHSASGLTGHGPGPAQIASRFD